MRDRFKNAQYVRANYDWQIASLSTTDLVQLREQLFADAPEGRLSPRSLEGLIVRHVDTELLARDDDYPYLPLPQQHDPSA